MYVCVCVCRNMNKSNGAYGNISIYFTMFVHFCNCLRKRINCFNEATVKTDIQEKQNPTNPTYKETEIIAVRLHGKKINR